MAGRRSDSCITETLSSSGDVLCQTRSTRERKNWILPAKGKTRHKTLKSQQIGSRYVITLVVIYRYLPGHFGVII